MNNTEYDYFTNDDKSNPLHMDGNFANGEGEGAVQPHLLFSRKFMSGYDNQCVAYMLIYKLKPFVCVAQWR